MGNPVIVWDRTNPLAQARGESKVANQALRDYAHMGAGRSLRKLHELYIKRASSNPLADSMAPTTRIATLNTWSFRFDWPARADRFDALAALDAEAAWRKRREEEREEEWQAARTLFRRARNMLEFPLVVEVEQEDGTKIERLTNWRMADAARFVDLAAKLARLAARMTDDQNSDLTQDSAGRVAIYLPDNGRDITDAASEKA